MSPGPDAIRRRLMEEVSEKRLSRFFVGDDATYTVNKDLRELCIFSPHNVIRDPPFSRIDLVSCRNLLIYFGLTFQSQVLPVFHFSLRPGGYLFLGTSENVGQNAELFAAIDKKNRIFQRRDHVASPLHFPVFLPRGRGSAIGGALRREPAAIATDLRRAVDIAIIERFVPAHVVVNAEGDIIHYSPRTGKYLEPAPACRTGNSSRWRGVASSSTFARRFARRWRRDGGSSGNAYPFRSTIGFNWSN